MKPKQKKRISHDYKVISFLILTIAFFGLFAIRPSVTMIVSLQKEKQEYENINRVLESKIQQIIATQTTYMKILDKKALINDAIPDHHEVQKTAELFRDPIDTTVFTIKGIRILPPEKEGLNTIVISFSGDGDFAAMMDFLDYIYDSRRLFTYRMFGMQIKPAGTESALLNLTTDLQTYYYVGKQ